MWMKYQKHQEFVRCTNCSGSLWAFALPCTFKRWGRFAPTYRTFIQSAFVFPLFKNAPCLFVGGHVFSWGQNQYGQLGLGMTGQRISTPHILQSLQGIPFAQISAGGAHSFALTLSGAVFGWGRNKFGQLGLNDTSGGCSKPSSSCEHSSPEFWITVRRSCFFFFSDRSFPALLKSLRSQRVIYICCGEDHTAALTKLSYVLFGCLMEYQCCM